MIILLFLFFWNVENFFAPGNIEGKNWGSTRFYAKCNSIAKTIFLAGDEYGQIPDIVAFAEVENREVLSRLVYGTSLRKLDYGIVHYDSPDHRGIDCALLYRRSHLSLLSSKACHLYDSTGAVMPTRDILLAVLSTGSDTLAVLVNHHPSKLGDTSGSRRTIAMERLLFLRDSLLAAGVSKIVAVGDFNDSVTPAPGITLEGSAGGTIKFNGQWQKIDGCPVLEGLSATEHIFDAQHLSTKDASYSGSKPLRSFSGPRYLGGVSDHYPIVLELRGLRP